MDSSIRDEVLKDFKESLSSIDFSSYNPTSKEFMTSLFLGLMVVALDCVNEDEAKVYSLEPVVVDSEKESDEISDEIHGSKKYFQRYLDTKDEMFRKMSQEELSHASYLVRKAYNKPIGSEERNKLKGYESTIEQLSEQIRNG